MPSIDVYGYIGHEMEAQSHIKAHIIFAVVNARQTRLAWYFYAQDMLLQRWQNTFDLISLGTGKLDRNEVFGEAIPYPTLNDIAGADITKLALRSPSITAVTLEMRDQKDKTTTCKLHKWLDPQSRPVSLQFDLTTVGKRRTLDVPKTGHVWFLGAERFSKHALKRGVRGPSPLTAGIDPYNPSF